MHSNVFNLLIKQVRNVLNELGFSEPTLPQVNAIPLILKGENVLLIAPTGSGKTEAVLLPIFSARAGGLNNSLKWCFSLFKVSCAVFGWPLMGGFRSRGWFLRSLLASG